MKNQFRILSIIVVFVLSSLSGVAFATGAIEEEMQIPTISPTIVVNGFTATSVDNTGVTYNVAVTIGSNYNFAAGTLVVTYQSGAVMYYSGVWNAASSSFSARIDLSCTDPMVSLTAIASAVNSFGNHVNSQLTETYNGGICFAPSIDPCDGIPWNVSDPGPCGRTGE